MLLSQGVTSFRLPQENRNNPYYSFGGCATGQWHTTTAAPRLPCPLIDGGACKMTGRHTLVPFIAQMPHHKHKDRVEHSSRRLVNPFP
jgi:hypothetical protein